MIIKICGITSEEAALAAKQYGADIIGFVFAESRRRIAIADAAKISRGIRGVGKAGVFVNQPLSEVLEIAGRCQLDFVQLHGEEPPGYCRQINRPVIKAFRVADHIDQNLINGYQVEWLLLDTFIPGQTGGTGITFDWNHTREIVGQLRQPFFVAGGLTPGNVAEAVRILRPGGVDVSGGVETGGRKDIEKIRRFIGAARAAGEGCQNARQNSRRETAGSGGR